VRIGAVLSGIGLLRTIALVIRGSVGTSRASCRHGRPRYARHRRWHDRGRGSWGRSGLAERL